MYVTILVNLGEIDNVQYWLSEQWIVDSLRYQGGQVSKSTLVNWWNKDYIPRSSTNM